MVGSPMAEVLTANIEKIQVSKVLETLDLTAGQYILLSAHREENIDTETNFLQLMNAVNAMAEKCSRGTGVLAQLDIPGGRGCWHSLMFQGDGGVGTA